MEDVRGRVRRYSRQIEVTNGRVKRWWDCVCGVREAVARSQTLDQCLGELRDRLSPVRSSKSVLLSKEVDEYEPHQEGSFVSRARDD